MEDAWVISIATEDEDFVPALGTFLYDTFTDTTGTDLAAHTMDAGGGWTENSGSWSIQSNAAQEATTGGAYYVCTAALGSAAQHVYAAYTAAGTTPYPMLVVRAAGNNDYFSLEEDLGSSTHILRLYETSGGTRTSRAASGDIGIGGRDFYLYFSAVGTTISGGFRSSLGEQTTLSYTSSDMQTNTRCGFGTKRTASSDYSGTASFTRFIGVPGTIPQTESGVVVFDLFVDADSTAITSHNPWVGAAWTQQGGNWTITSDLVSNNTNTGGYLFCTQDCGQADVTVILECPSRTGSNNYAPTITLRYQDSNNYWIAGYDSGAGNQLYIQERLAGTSTTRASAGNPDIGSGAHASLKFVSSGTSLTATWANIQSGNAITCNYTSGDLQAKTIVGFGEYRDGSSYQQSEHFNFFLATHP